MNVIKNVETKPISKGFSKAPRSNFAIEIARILSLFLLVVIHVDHIMDTVHLGWFTRLMYSNANLSFGVNLFAAITGLFTIGSGKEYFLRNTSRFLFVIVLVMSIGLPTYYSMDVNIGSSHYDIFTFILGGRDTWYLWAIGLVSIVFPLIKIPEKFLSYKKTMLLVAIVMASTSLISQLSFGLPFLKIFGVGMSAHILHKLYLAYSGDKKKMFLIISTILAGIASGIVAYFGSGALGGIFCVQLVIWLSTTKYKTPKWFNVIVRNSYFVYELHFIFQIYWMQIMKNNLGQFDLTTHKVIWNYSYEMWEHFGFVVSTSLVASWIVTPIQIYVWERVVGKQIYKIQPWSPVYILSTLLYFLLYSAHEYIHFWQGKI